jgi:hypothetical protein
VASNGYAPGCNGVTPTPEATATPIPGPLPPQTPPPSTAGPTITPSYQSGNNGSDSLLDAVGVRVEGSSWLGLGGFDVNLDILYFLKSKEAGVFLTIGGQGGGGGGAGGTGGFLTGFNMPNKSVYSGASVTPGGATIPIIPLGVNIEGDVSFNPFPNSDGSIPNTAYFGAGPLQPEVGGYGGGGYTIDLLAIIKTVYNTYKWAR